ncbi:hypothetical protein [Segetibacter sp.]|uniref:hypothetical protein n=1 Tax=Segetibacter sp. TaxID=2231182 RepID=UPI00260C79D8|nr:hypothetical protein [Segetibacter sp.]MCW3080676.1 hypothetical protein [Segetibacter sp.]
MPNESPKSTDDKDAMVDANQIASDKNSKIKEAEIKKYDDLFPQHQPQEDLREISSTDDV